MRALYRAARRDQSRSGIFLCKKRAIRRPRETIGPDRRLWGLGRGGGGDNDPGGEGRTLKAANRGLRRDYAVSIDRAGYAIAAGGMSTGLLIAGLVALGGQHGVAALCIAWLVGSIFAMLGLTAVAAPIWLAVHALGARGPVSAASTGVSIALFVSLGMQTYGSGILRSFPAGHDNLAYGWISAIATSAFAAIIAAGIGILMWRIAYRRIA